MIFDFIVVGGGLAASVVSNRLLEQDPSRKILVVEAGPDANCDASLIWPNATNTIGGTYDWNISSVPQVNADNRNISLPVGKALGGGTVINSGGWVRGDKTDYDLWGETVGDSRWSYSGLLPYMKKTEEFWNKVINPGQHGHGGNVFIQREYVLESWEALGIKPVPLLDANAGEPLGVGELNENKHNGRREIAAAVYSLDDITVLTDTLVEKVILDRKDNGTVVATGIKLANGTEYFGNEIIVSAGGLHSPQILMLSGIGPADQLKKHGIEVVVDSPDVGQNLADHPLGAFAWKVKDPEDGWAIGSGNPLFDEPQYSWGTPADFIVSTTVPKEGLAAAIEADEGAAPDWNTHPLLKENRTWSETVFQYGGAADGSLVAFGAIGLLVTSRGSVTLASASIGDKPLVDPNFFGTEVDRYAFREMLRLQIRFASSNETVIGREILDGEVPGAGLEPLTLNSTDTEIDARARAAVGSSYHPHGSNAMGKVVDTDLKVKGVEKLRVVDASVFPVIITGHLQVATFAMAEQAAVIIGATGPRRTRP